MVIKTVRLTVHGRVQGVFYRASLQQLARILGVTGYAVNNPDGTVTVIAQGAPDKLEEFIRQCYHASKGSHVSTIQTATLTCAPHYQQFDIR